MSHFRKNFITGVFTALPIGITVWIIYKIFMILDSIIGNVIYKALGMTIPGLGLLVTIVLIYLAGLFTSNYLGKQIHKRFEGLFESMPFIKSIFVPVKDVMKNFSSKNSNNFKKAVLVQYPMEGSNSIGFITKENVMVGDKELTIIFIPTTPNPTSGFLVYVKNDMYTELNIPVDVALKTIISLGSISPEVIGVKEL